MATHFVIYQLVNNYFDDFCIFEQSYNNGDSRNEYLGKKDAFPPSDRVVKTKLDKHVK